MKKLTREKPNVDIEALIHTMCSMEYTGAKPKKIDFDGLTEDYKLKKIEALEKSRT